MWQRWRDFLSNPCWFYSTVLAIYLPHKWFTNLIACALIQIYKIVYYLSTWKIYKLFFFFLLWRQKGNLVQFRSRVFAGIGIANTVNSAETKITWDKNKMFPRAFLLNKYLYFPWLQVLASRVYIQPFVLLSLLLNVSAADTIFAVVETILFLQVEIPVGPCYWEQPVTASFLLWTVL